MGSRATFLVPRWLRTVAACLLVAIVAFYLLTEHTQHTLGALPYVVLLLCPVAHLLMHHGHHDRAHRPSDTEEHR